jgi:hypothetical protein
VRGRRASVLSVGLCRALGRERTAPRRPCAYTLRASQTAASLLLRPHAPPPGTLSAWDRTRAQKGDAATALTPNAVGPRPPAGLGDPASVDRSRFSDGTAPQGRRCGGRLSRLRGPMRERRGRLRRRRLMAARAVCAQPGLAAEVDARDRTPREELEPGLSHTDANRPRHAEASRGRSHTCADRRSRGLPCTTTRAPCIAVTRRFAIRVFHHTRSATNTVALPSPLSRSY